MGQYTPRWVLLRHIGRLVTMNDAGDEFDDALVVMWDGVIVHVGRESDVSEGTKGGEWIKRALGEGLADVVEIVLDRHVVVPGLVNCHHHMYQTLTRCVAQDKELFGWLSSLYDVWGHLTPDHVRVSATVAMAELILSGCTTSTDHLYLFPNGCRVDDEIDAAKEIGIRFHPCRGAMSLGRSKGGLPPDHLVEDEGVILADMQRLIEKHHDPSRYSMLRIALAPCSPFSVTEDLMRNAAHLARQHGVRLHTHLAENDNDVDYSLRVLGNIPGEYAKRVGWVGDDVWFAHCVKLSGAECDLFASTGTGVCHCPSSNLRLASGIAPVVDMIKKGVPVGLGVDGSASNDSSNMLAEARLAMLLQRANGNPGAMTAREALRLATVGGARLLGRDGEIGKIVEGYAADIAAFRTDSIGMAGAQLDVAAAVVFCSPGGADVVVIHGKIVVRDGHLLTIDVPATVKRHNELAKDLWNSAAAAKEGTV